jgi:hypothetical protein
MTTKTYKFQVLRGSHRVGPEYGERMANGARRIIKPGYNVKRGEIVETTTDLAAKYPSLPPKFLRIDVVQEDEEDLKTSLMMLDKKQLISKAEAEEIDLNGCHTKDQIISRFLEVLQA